MPHPHPPGGRVGLRVQATSPRRERGQVLGLRVHAISERPGLGQGLGLLMVHDACHIGHSLGHSLQVPAGSAPLRGKAGRELSRVSVKAGGIQGGAAVLVLLVDARPGRQQVTHV